LLSIRDQVSHPCRTTSKFVVSYILILILTLDIRRRVT
jgi:hypothetical protein